LELPGESVLETVEVKEMRSCVVFEILIESTVVVVLKHLVIVEVAAAVVVIFDFVFESIH
jgi:hypothetical protein